ncbi:hypothetical protein C2W64_01771 [Brevibacillus laterosporus]|nr:hypothetical protein C2W64_01771 [Brevibacillus laterosporus]
MLNSFFFTIIAFLGILFLISWEHNSLPFSKEIARKNKEANAR